PMKSSLQIISIVQARVDTFLKEIFNICESSKGIATTGTLSETIASEIAICEAIEVVVRRQRNERTLFSHLPADIVHSIFGAALDVDRIHNSYLPDEELEENDEQLESMRLVSSGWNRFLLSSPRYWQAINITKPQEAIKLALERSGSAPLHIHSVPWRSQDPSMSLIPAARIQTLRSNDPDEYLLYRSVLQYPLPALQTLELAAPSWIDDDDVGPLGNLPSLRHLTACRWQPPADAAFLRNIKELILWRDLEPDMELLRVLSACPNLEHLEIAFMNKAVRGEPLTAVGPVTLPRLRSIGLDLKSSESAVKLIRRLIIPQCTQRTITVADPGDLGLYIADYRRLVCSEERCIGQHPESAAVLLNNPFFGNNNGMEYKMKSPKVRLIVFSLPEAPAFHDLIQQFQTTFRGSPLSVTIKSPSERATSLLKCIGDQNIQTIAVHFPYGSTRTGDLLKAIGSHPANPPGQNKQAVNGTTDQPFKSLRSIEIYDARVNLVDFIGLAEEHLHKDSKPMLEEIVLFFCSLEGMGRDQAVESLKKIGITLQLLGSYEDEDGDNHDDYDEDDVDYDDVDYEEEEE
ncbi:hypothetical protein FRC01_008200, partial [Tulasnella sp. 417]